jgi:hypothetical protein
MASDPTNGTEQNSSLTRLIADFSVGAVLIASLATVYGLEGSWQRLIGNRQHESGSTESQAAALADSSGEAPAEGRPPAAASESRVASVDEQAASDPRDEVGGADTSAGDGEPMAENGSDTPVQRKLTGIIAGFEAFKPELLPQKPPHQAELTKQPPPPVEPERVAELPDVPTFKELGLEPVNRPALYGIWAPKGLPAPLVAQLNVAVRRVLQDPAVIKRLEATGSRVVANSPVEFAAQLKAEYEVYKKVVDAQKLKLD